MNLDTITIIIIAANVIISYKGFEDFSFFEKYKFNIGGIKRGEQIRMFSSAFLHVDMQHLIFNMVTLFFFASSVINEVGTTNFLILYLGSLIGGSLLSYIFHQNHYHYNAVGASGAVTGVLYAAILFQPNMTINFFIPGWMFGVGYLLYSIYGMKSRRDNIGHEAHFGGAIGGFVLAIIFKPEVLTNDLKTVALLAVPIIILFVMMRLGKI